MFKTPYQLARRVLHAIAKGARKPKIINGSDRIFF